MCLRKASILVDETNVALLSPKTYLFFCNIIGHILKGRRVGRNAPQGITCKHFPNNYFQYERNMGTTLMLRLVFP